MIYGLDPRGNDIPWTFAYEISQEDCYDSCKRESNCLLVLYRANSRSCFPKHIMPVVNKVPETSHYRVFLRHCLSGMGKLTS